MNSIPLNAFLGLLTLLVTLPVTSFAKAGKPHATPTGEYQVVFKNGVVQKCVFGKYSTVKVSQPNRESDGRVEIEDGKIIVRYEDDRLEHWNPAGNAYIVNHWHPASGKAQKKQPQIGLAEKVLQGELEVHEWGTFTVLQGSDGKTVRWYQSPDKIVDLPSFVRRPLSYGKVRAFNFANQLDSVRMETPVLYFYPKGPMEVRVSAAFPTGEITEVFPPSSFDYLQSGNTTWRGRLLPPDAPEKSFVPTATGPKGRHYGAARAVPEAWFFSQLPPNYEQRKDAKGNPLPSPIDHFIFYRGAGHSEQFPLRAVEQSTPGSYQLYNYFHQTIPKLFALRVSHGKSSWTTIDQLQRVKYDSKKKVSLNVHSLTFPEEEKDTKVVTREIREAMVAALHAEGLTLAEAKAMVATWDNLWFIEPGTRILAVLPQSYADEMVPLQISPKPEKLERVFVARLELLNRSNEAALVKILNPASNLSEEEAASKLSGLELGRYSAGGMARAKTLINQEIEKRFYQLEKLGRKKPSDSRRANLTNE